MNQSEDDREYSNWILFHMGFFCIRFYCATVERTVQKSDLNNTPQFVPCYITRFSILRVRSQIKIAIQLSQFWFWCIFSVFFFLFIILHLLSVQQHIGSLERRFSRALKSVVWTEQGAASINRPTESKTTQDLEKKVKNSHKKDSIYFDLKSNLRILKCERI